ncbi:Asp23/Gls24 family envelope stress response protein [Enterococcus faecalis]|uniref:Asp23/Gls24 family envelope stress response protein n=1 Tax=Enterococcus TaxID=1350 RepID=UPI001A9757F0|nr:Asp23/Gls24 family envelope stress response protein [Enterococcus faecalis]MBO1126626.1 Asp23/Gls24 family envelope stress response protein [Enterococcus faecalis]
MDKNTTIETKRQRFVVKIDEQVIKKIAGLVTNNIEGVLSLNGNFISGLKDQFAKNGDITKGVQAEVGKKQVAVDLDVILEYGIDIPETAEKIKKSVTKEIETLTHLEVIEININVVDVQTRQEFKDMA